MEDIYGLNEVLNQPTDIVSLLSEKNNFKTVENIPKKKKSAHFARRSTNVSSGDIEMESSFSKTQKVLKLDENSKKESEKNFHFPRRDRFNEDMESEIKSIRSNSDMKLNSSIAFNRKLKKGLQQSMKGEKSVNSKYTKGSKRTVTKSLLSKYFKKDTIDMQSGVTTMKKSKI
jgi:hypothetical protein